MPKPFTARRCAPQRVGFGPPRRGGRSVRDAGCCGAVWSGLMMQCCRDYHAHSAVPSSMFSTYTPCSSAGTNGIDYSAIGVCGREDSRRDRRGALGGEKAETLDRFFCNCLVGPRNVRVHSDAVLVPVPVPVHVHVHVHVHVPVHEDGASTRGCRSVRSKSKSKSKSIPVLTAPGEASSKTPLRPLREALRMGMGRSGWESGCRFGRPLGCPVSTGRYVFSLWPLIYYSKKRLTLLAIIERMDQRPARFPLDGCGLRGQGELGLRRFYDD